MSTILTPLDPADARSVREMFSQAGYTTEKLTAAFGTTGLPSRSVLDLFRAGVRWPESQLQVLFRLYWLAMEVDRETSVRFLPEWYLSVAARSGLLRATAGGFAADVRLSPFGGLLIASDHVFSRDSNVVLWPNPTTLLVYHMTVPRDGRETLDLGAGNGVLGIAAAKRSVRVTATDLNAAAAAFSRFNAALNGAENVELLTGDGFAPVAGRTFDLILANPPFFVTPKFRKLFSDNPLELDQFCRKLIREAPEFLEEGGFLQMLCEWVEVDGEDWRDRLAEWLEGSACDAWVMRDYARRAADYAMIRVEEKEHASMQSRAEEINDWLEFFESRRVREIHGGLIVIRKRTDGTHWREFDSLDHVPSAPFGDTILRIFENHDAVDAVEIAGKVREVRPRLNGNARLVQTTGLEAGEWVVRGLEIRLTGGLQFNKRLDPTVAEFLQLCDGSRPFGQVVGEIAGRHGLNQELVGAECWRVCRAFLFKGLMDL